MRLLALDAATKRYDPCLNEQLLQAFEAGASAIVLAWHLQTSIGAITGRLERARRRREREAR